MMKAFRYIGFALCCVVTGCTTDRVAYLYAQDSYRFNGVTHSAGDAVAANSAMQIIDPTPKSASRLKLNVPAERNDTKQDKLEPVRTTGLEGGKS